MSYRDSADFVNLRKFIKKNNLYTYKALEIGSGTGELQDAVNEYTGVDIQKEYIKHYHKPYHCVSQNVKYPFKDNSFDFVWTLRVFEHIINLQLALNEISRLLKKDGFLYFAPAWQCRSWAANGYNVRPYSDFNLKGKLIKAFIPIRNSLLWRSLFIFPKRCLYAIQFYLFKVNYKKIKYKKIKANYEFQYVTDSNACNQIDPFDAILWFKSNGFTCISHNNFLKVFFIKNGAIIFQKNN